MIKALNFSYLFLILISSQNCLSQSSDNYWPLGYDSYSGTSSFGGMQLSFPGNTAVLDTHSRPMWFVFTNAAICNDKLLSEERIVILK